MRNDLTDVLNEYNSYTKGLGYERKLELTLILEKFNQSAEEQRPKFFTLWNQNKYWEYVLDIYFCAIISALYKEFYITNFQKIHSNFQVFCRAQCLELGVIRPDSNHMCEFFVEEFIINFFREYKIYASQSYVISSQPGNPLFNFCLN